MNGRVCGGCGFWSRLRSFKHTTGACACFVRRDLGSATYSRQFWMRKYWRFTSALSGASDNTQEDTMNSIIYIVGLVVIIGVILSYFGFR
jgi:hypothetical protein